MDLLNDDNVKIPLPQFLKLLTNNNVPVPKAMAVAGKVYKEYNTREKVAQLSDVKLKTLGVDSQEDRKLVMTALRKSGYACKGERSKKAKALVSTEASGSQSPGSSIPPISPSRMSAVDVLTTPKNRKRKAVDDVNEFLPSAPSGEVEEDNSWEFNEVLEEDILKTKSAVINRAPVMMAWSMLVAERMHFSRPEALSIASVYTEMNAISKGISVGIYNKDRERGIEADRHGSQPYVELMGRRPLYRSQTGQWRALSNGKPVPPISAFSYISRSFRQTTPYIVGALKLLADSYSAKELNGNAWTLYAQFRPEVNEWGKRSEVQCSVIMDLCKKTTEHNAEPHAEEVQEPAGSNETSGGAVDSQNHEPERKKMRGLTLEEYEAALDEDTTFDNVDLDFIVSQPTASPTGT